MNKAWSWVLGVLIALIILSFIVYGRSTRQSYWVARKALDQPVVIVVAPSDQVLQWRLHHWFER